MMIRLIKMVARKSGLRKETAYEQIRGVEPPSPAWEASILPMNHICMTIFYRIYQFFSRSLKEIF